MMQDERTNKAMEEDRLTDLEIRLIFTLREKARALSEKAVVEILCSLTRAEDQRALERFLKENPEAKQPEIIAKTMELNPAVDLTYVW